MASNFILGTYDLSTLFLTGSGGSATNFISGSTDLDGVFAASLGLWDRRNGGTQGISGGSPAGPFSSNMFIESLDLADRFQSSTAVPLHLSKTEIDSANNPATSVINLGTCSLLGMAYTDPSLTYSWVRTSGSAHISAHTPNAASTTFSYTANGGYNCSATFTCTISDTLGNSLTVGTLTVNACTT